MRQKYAMLLSALLLLLITGEAKLGGPMGTCAPPRPNHACPPALSQVTTAAMMCCSLGFSIVSRTPHISEAQLHAGARAGGQH